MSVSEYNLQSLNSLPRTVVEITTEGSDSPRMDVQRCLEVISTSQVRARGWSFPHFMRDQIIVGQQNQFIGAKTDFNGFTTDHIERWRLYRSGHFLFTGKLWEVPGPEIQERMRQNAIGTSAEDGRVAGFVSFIGQIYSIGEAYVFASRLAQAVPLDSPVNITVGLKNVREWALGSSDFGVDLWGYVTHLDNPEHTATIPLDALISDPLAHAVTATVGIFQQFSWLNPSPSMIQNWQRQIFK